MQLLIDIVMNPRKYDSVQNTTLQFDAAEQLLTYWNYLGAVQKNKVIKVLIMSGRYK